MTKFLTKFLAALVLIAALTPASFAQLTTTAGFVDAAEYGAWEARSTGSIASGAQAVTIRGSATFTTPKGGRSFMPFATNALLTIDRGVSGVEENVTPSAVSCVYGTFDSTCTITATFSNAHAGNFTIKSATFGIQEAVNDISGGTVFAANNWGGSSVATSVGLTVGASGKSVVDGRSGNFQFYKWNGSAYAASTSPSSSLAPGATVTAVTGTAAFNAAIQDQTANHGITNISIGADVDGAFYDCMKTRSNNADGRATTTIVTGDDLCQISVSGADGTNYIPTASIVFDSTGTIGTTRVPSVIKFFTGTDAAPTVKTLALTLGADQSTNIAKMLVYTKGADVVSGSCTSGDCVPTGSFFDVTGTTTVDGFTSTGITAGTVIYVRTTGSVTFNDGGTVAGGFAAMNLSGALSMTANDIVTLMYDGTTWTEVALSQN